MDLKTWFKGLAVFVASSFVTSVAASSLDPSAFNFSHAGLARLGSLATLIGVKAVYLYMKQSPLPGATAADWTKLARAFAFVALLPLLAGSTGCYNSWEQNTYVTLQVGKAVIDCAVAGYNHFDADIRHACSASPDDPAFDPSTFYLPQTREAQQAIEKAREVQVACVEAFAGYAVAKVAKDSSQTIAEKQAVVVAYLAQLPALLDAVRGLRSSTSAKTTSRLWPPEWLSREKGRTGDRVAEVAQRLRDVDFATADQLRRVAARLMPVTSPMQAMTTSVHEEVQRGQ